MIPCTFRHFSAVQQQRPHRQSGIALIAMAAALVVLCAVLLAGTTVLQSRGGGKGATDQQQQARQAEHAINGFAALYGRPPCPATRKDGAEDCAGPAKGWLPVETLEKTGLFVGANPGSHADVRYMVYRGHGSGSHDPDLAEPAPAISGAVGAGNANGFIPAVVDASPLTGYPVVSSSVDLCGKLRSLLPNPDPTRRWESGDPALDGPARADRAHIPLPAAPGGASGLMNVAYALAVASPREARPSHDTNADFSVPKMESPLDPPRGVYADVVRIVEPRGLYQALACGAAIASLDNLAVASSWSADAAGLRQGNIDGGNQIMQMGIPIAIGDGAFVISDSIDTVNGVYNQIDLATKALVPGVILNVPLFLTYLRGHVEATLGLVYSTIDTARSMAGAAVDSLFVFEYVNVAQKSEKIPVWAGATDILQKADETGLVNRTAP